MPMLTLYLMVENFLIYSVFRFKNLFATCMFLFKFYLLNLCFRIYFSIIFLNFLVLKEQGEHKQPTQLNKECESNLNTSKTCYLNIIDLKMYQNNVSGKN